MTKGITFTDKQQAREFASQFPRAKIKRVGFWPFSRFVVYVSEGDLSASDYRRKLRGLPSLEGEIKASNKQGG